MTVKKVHILHQPTDLSRKAATGISLHCHTEYSKEMLDFVPHYADKLPIIASFWNREKKLYRKETGKDLDFSNAYWSPPMPPESVHEIEEKQIENAGLHAIVSITDHDSIDANLLLNNKEHKAPISLEWTVPFKYGFFHLGVHNLPEKNADQITKALLEYTFSEEEPNNRKLHELFALLNEMPEVLIILNHPIWDIELAGQEKHNDLLRNFISEHGKWIHALEINGFRSWSENKKVIQMAHAYDFPIATGGDRHGCKPNTVINLTHSKTFSEFVEEIRVDKKSEVVLMPEYKQPLPSRQMQSFSEILDLYPEFPDDRKRWFDRVFFDLGDETGLVSLSDHGWDLGGPLWLRWAIKTLGFFGSPAMRPFLSLVRKKKDRVPKIFNDAKLESSERAGVAEKRSPKQKSTKTGFAS